MYTICHSAIYLRFPVCSNKRIDIVQMKQKLSISGSNILHYNTSREKVNRITIKYDTRKKLKFNFLSFFVQMLVQSLQ